MLSLFHNSTLYVELRIHAVPYGTVRCLVIFDLHTVLYCTVPVPYLYRHTTCFDTHNTPTSISCLKFYCHLPFFLIFNRYYCITCFHLLLFASTNLKSCVFSKYLICVPMHSTLRMRMKVCRHTYR